MAGKGVTMLQGKKPKMGVTMLNTNADKKTSGPAQDFTSRTPPRKVAIDADLKKRGL